MAVCDFNKRHAMVSGQKIQRKKITREKKDFPKDGKGRTILANAEDMREWVELGFEAQRENRPSDLSFLQDVIDLTGCVLYISYPIGSDDVKSKIFNICDMADVVPGIKKLPEGDDYLFEVEHPIRFDGSELYGNFFHYVKFRSFVSLDEVEINNTCSFFKCLFEGPAYMQGIKIKGTTTFEQCRFEDGLNLYGSNIKGLDVYFRLCEVRREFNFYKASLECNDTGIDGYYKPLQFVNCSIENINLSELKSNHKRIYFVESEVKGLKINDFNLDLEIDFLSCIFSNQILLLRSDSDDGKHNWLKTLRLLNCNNQAKFHIENTRFDEIEMNYGEVSSFARFRIHQCVVEKLHIDGTTVYGQQDLTNSQIAEISLDGVCVHGYLAFNENKVGKYHNRDTIRLLKNEALKVNDKVNAIHLYAEEMKMLLKEKKTLTYAERIPLVINGMFSKFGESWWRPLWLTIVVTLVLTLLMLAFGSTEYAFSKDKPFIGWPELITIYLNNINVFSIPMFSEVIKEYGLNVIGELLHLLTKAIVAYGVYQFTVGFRKYSRK